MNEGHNILEIILNNWQIVFLYIFKYLNDMSQHLKRLELDIHILKHENKRRFSDNNTQGKPLF